MTNEKTKIMIIHEKVNTWLKMVVHYHKVNLHVILRKIVLLINASLDITGTVQ